MLPPLLAAGAVGAFVEDKSGMGCSELLPAGGHAQLYGGCASYLNASQRAQTFPCARGPVRPLPFSFGPPFPVQADETLEECMLVRKGGGGGGRTPARPLSSAMRN